ncbi:sensor domain-containing diguanylate cyclase [Bacillus mesophilum]|uniref:Sensor domain-containing diguanylate cyclase n=2 Tax=Bacillus mesophilum TaxID=1071718 RepID=A0A7V7UZG8_9BACI|nr:sensor domain-containing diguanylate cyclase [Bacillus mesophilum]KAB2334097.1 sensor domain-containing diguanylate cyclase [Bacillus mesophilum]
MKMKVKYKKIIWAAWILLMPASLWIAYHFYPPPVEAVPLTDLAAFFLLTFLVALLPVVINNTPVFLLQWVSMAVFLLFGLFIEILLAQFAIFALLARLNISKNKQLYRLPLNSSMFLLVSLFSGMLYYAVGGVSGDQLTYNTESFFIALLYPVFYYILNLLLLIFIDIVLTDKKKFLFGKDMIWDMLSSLASFPVGYVLFILYKEIGVIAVLCVGIPFASLSLIMSLYSSSENVNAYLQKVAEIGHQLAERLKVGAVLDLFMEKLIQMLPADYVYLMDIVDGKELQIIRSYENGQINEAVMKPLKKGEGISGFVWEQKKGVLFKTRKEWQLLIKGYVPANIESIVSVPVVRNSEVTGVLFLASTRKAVFDKSLLMIVDILCSHLAIAVENANHYEKTKEKSERCALTKLYNYRYLEKRLNIEFAKLARQEIYTLSLIILDLDHFKSINDNYGHQSGNEILCELANRLTAAIGDSGIVARYGGEEFVIVLPNCPKHEAIQFAETLRLLLANKPFQLSQHIGAEQIDLEIQITASFGVAAAPENAEDPMTLIRHADRALYTGAKRAGRNKVAEYVK